MEEIVFGKGQDHMHREKTGLSKAGDQKMLVLKVCITLFFEEESLLHMRTNIKKGSYWQGARRKPLGGMRL